MWWPADNNVQTGMAEHSKSFNTNRAVCHAAGDPKRAEMTAPGDSSQIMQAIFLKDHVKRLIDIQPTYIPRPTFESYVASLGEKKRPVPSGPLLHVKITHTAINHVDLLYAHGVHQNNKSGLFVPPFTLGLEFSGIVAAVHNPENDACRFSPGDKVWGGSMGTHAEELITPASAVHHLPSPLWSLHDIAAIGAGTIPVSYGALTTIAGLKAGETILVHAAAGGLGVYAVQVARALGAKIIGTVGSQHKLSMVEDLLRDPQSGHIPEGEGVVNYSKDGWEKDVVALCKQTGKDGVDVVYDTVGLVLKSIRCTTFNGRIVVVGFAARTGTGAEAVEELEKIPVNRVLLKQIKLLGYRYGETSRRLPHETVKMWQGLYELLSQGPMVIKPVVYKTYKGLDHANEAMEALHRRQVFGKAVIEVCNEYEALQEVLQRSKQAGTAVSARL